MEGADGLKQRRHNAGVAFIVGLRKSEQAAGMGVHGDDRVVMRLRGIDRRFKIFTRPDDGVGGPFPACVVRHGNERVAQQAAPRTRSA
jgi:hypothetical protein